MSLKDFNRSDDMFSLCGLNCGLCGYRLQGNCNGCFKDSFCAKVCPMAPCSVKHGGLQYCFECPEYPCRHYDGFDSYDTLVLHRNQRKDMQKAKEMGIDAYLEEQREKKRILERLLEDYNDGQQDVFYCRAVNMLELEALKEIMEDADKRAQSLNAREKAELMKTLMYKCAEERGCQLELS